MIFMILIPFTELYPFAIACKIGLPLRKRIQPTDILRLVFWEARCLKNSRYFQAPRSSFRED
jgi:hypothetical protein